MLGADVSRDGTAPPAESNVVRVSSSGDRSAIELELRRRIEELEDFFENAAESVHSVAEDGTILWANRAELELLGYTRHQYVGRNIADFHVDREVIDDMLARLARNETLRDYEARMRCRDGSIRHVLVSSNVLWRDGKFAHTRCFTRDITARKRTHEALGRLFEITSSLSGAQTPKAVAEVIVRQALESAGAVAGGAYMLDRDGTAMTLLGAAGYPPEVMDRFTSIAVDADLPLADVVRRGAPVFLPSETVREKYGEATLTGGASNTHSIAALPLVVGDRAIGALGFSFADRGEWDDDRRTFLKALATQCAQALDRAHLLEAERAARRQAEASEARSAFLAEASSVLASSLEYETTLARVASLAVPRVADWCLVELATPDSRMSPDSVAAAHVDPKLVDRVREYRRRFPSDPTRQTGVAHVMRTGSSEFHADIPDDKVAVCGLPFDQVAMLRELGVRSSMIVPMAARGRVLGAIVLVRGVSGRRFESADLPMAEELARRAAIAIDNARLYREAQKAVRAREDLLAVVSHDLRGPLGSIAMNAAVILNGENDVDDENDRHGEKRRRAGERIVRATRTMERLIRDLLDFATIESGHLSVELEPQPIRQIVREAIESLRPLVGPRSFELVDTLPAEHDGLVSCDRARVLQVLWNLVGNAVKATTDDGSIAIEVGSDAGQVVVSVKDSGRGIEPNALARIFDRYWTDRTTRQGLGLGLFITKGLVDAHGGRIWAESVVGQGSTFYFTLTSASLAGRAAAGRAERRIVIIDDDEALAAELSELLTENGYTVQIFSDGTEALKSFDAGSPPSLILLDLMMPGMDGWECFTALKTNPRLRLVPIVVMSSVIQGQGPLLGATGYLRKPFRAEQILDLADRSSRDYVVGAANG